MATIYARLINQNGFNSIYYFQLAFIRLMKKIKEVMELNFFLKLNNNHNLTETDIDNIDVKSQLEHGIEIHETEDFGWIFDKIN